ncbi:hypothetical protein Avbf_11444 [Armadillidium vulgare]|nr:hypothetical protein Avbf_11444 [Armadillidium vulgare]
MVCTRASCQFHWCWVCQTEWTRECMAAHWFVKRICYKHFALVLNFKFFQWFIVICKNEKNVIKSNIFCFCAALKYEL